MKHETTARYPAPAGVVIKMFVDRNFHTRKLEAIGLSRFEVLDHRFDGKDFRIRIERKVPLRAPGVIRKIVPAETTVLNEECWNVVSRTGRVKVEPKGVPVEMSCTAAMRDEDAGCVITYRWDIRAKVPVVGGVLEKFVASDLDSRSAEETRAAIALLKDYRE